jgi:hypothetical protein
MPFPSAPDVSQFTRPDGTVDQQALFAAMMAYNQGYNPDGDPSLGANVDFGYSGLVDQYGNTSRHFTPEELAQNGGAPMTFFDGSGGVFTTTDQQEIADRRDDQRTRMQQGAVTIAGGILGANFLPGGAFNGGAGAGAGAGAGTAAADGLGVASLPPGVGYLPGGVPAGAFSATGAIPAMASLPAAISTPAAVNALTGVAPAVGGNFLENWLPEITGGVNALIGAGAAKDAADLEAEYLQRAIDEQRRQFDLTREDWAPWMETGRDALNQLKDPNTHFMASPDYNFRRTEGTRGIENSFSARGGAQSGNALRALAEFNSGLASGEFGNWFDRQSTRAGLGTTGTNVVTNAGQNTSANVSNSLAGQGVSRASGVYNSRAAIAGGLNDVASNWLYRRRMGRP